MPPTTLLFLSLPPSIFLGLDLLSITATPKFHGIKNLLPGWHFVYSAPDASLSIRHGQWFYVTQPSSPRRRREERRSLSDGHEEGSAFSVWRWCKEGEYLKRDDDTSGSEPGVAPGHLRGGLGSALLDYVEPGGGGNTGVAPGDLVREWRELTGYISESLLERVLREDHVGQARERGTTATATEENGPSGRDSTWTISSVSSAPQDEDVIPGLTPSEARLEGEKELNFLQVDLRKTWRDGAVGSERTDGARDKSWYLGHLIERVAGDGQDRKAGASQLLGELQLCFLMTLTLANWSCLQQWKRILAVLLGCRNALAEVGEYFVAVLQVLRVQLRHCEDVEGGLFDFKEDGAGWLKATLTQFRGNVQDVFGQSQGEGLKLELSKIESDLRERYSWENWTDVLKRGLLELEDGEKVDMEMNGADEEDETGEYAPVVVELS